MPNNFLLEHIKGLDERTASSDTGHTVHSDHVFYITPDGQKILIIYKENKNKNADLSIKEIALSEISRLIMSTNSTPKYYLVQSRQTGAVTGVACEHIQMTIGREKDIQTTQFQSIDYAKEENRYVFKNVAVTKTDDIPFTFLNQLPPGFFSYLMNTDEITIDMESLANILVSKYMLEDDDLHKANIGFYITNKDNKPYLTFFNIDHDLNLSDSIMSFIHSRVPNWTYGERAFNITVHDLSHFPDLKNAQNHYWPTRKRALVKPGDNKIYSSNEERNTFQDLRHDPHFNRYKWKRFLKGILIPYELMELSLSQHFDKNNPQMASEIDLVAQAVNERMMKLCSVLLSIPEFQHYLISEEGIKDSQALRKELSIYLNELRPANHQLTDKIQNEIDTKIIEYRTFCAAKKEHAFSKGDTPLHVAIRMGGYRFEESQKAFKEYINTPNEQGDLPIDIAAQMVASYQIGDEQSNPGKDPIAIMQHLLNHGAKMTSQAETVLRNNSIELKKYQFPSKYYDRKITDYGSLRQVISEIGKDHNLCLKTRKTIATNVIKQHINQLTKQELQQFKKELNGTAKHRIAPEFLFISQLRSSLWIVRIIRGLYGNSSTKMELNKQIERGESRLKHHNSPRFFATEPAKTNDDHRPEKTPQLKT